MRATRNLYFSCRLLWGEIFALSTLDSNMKGDHAPRHVVIVHMSKTALFHEGLELILRGMHADGFGQVAIARVVAGHELAKRGSTLKEYQS